MKEILSSEEIIRLAKQFMTVSETMFQAIPNYRVEDFARDIERAVLERVAPYECKPWEKWVRLKPGQVVAEKGKHFCGGLCFHEGAPELFEAEYRT